MPPSVQAITNDALALPPVERAGLIEELLSSFDRQTRSSVDMAWSAEAEERIDAFDRGEIASAPLDEVIARIKLR